MMRRVRDAAAAGWGAAVTWRSIAPVPSYTMLPKMAPVSVDDTCTTHAEQAESYSGYHKKGRPMGHAAWA